MISATDANRRVLEDFVELFMGRLQVREAFEKHVAHYYVQHAPGFGQGREATIAALEKMFSNMPAPNIEIERILVDGEFGAVHLRAQSGPEDPGIIGVDIFRFEHGKIAEHWEVVQPARPQSADRAY